MTCKFFKISDEKKINKTFLFYSFSVPFLGAGSGAVQVGDLLR